MKRIHVQIHNERHTPHARADHLDVGFDCRLGIVFETVHSLADWLGSGSMIPAQDELATTRKFPPFFPKTPMNMTCKTRQAGVVDTRAMEHHDTTAAAVADD